MPIAAQFFGDFVDRAPHFPNLDGHPPSRSGGQQRPLRTYRGILFDERPERAPSARARPAPFPPPQTNRLAESRQINQHHTAIALGPHPTAAAPTGRAGVCGTGLPPPAARSRPARRYPPGQTSPRPTNFSHMRVGSTSTGVLLPRMSLLSSDYRGPHSPSGIWGHRVGMLQRSSTTKIHRALPPPGPLYEEHPPAGLHQCLDRLQLVRAEHGAPASPVSWRSRARASCSISCMPVPRVLRSGQRSRRLRHDRAGPCLTRIWRVFCVLPGQGGGFGGGVFPLHRPCGGPVVGLGA